MGFLKEIFCKHEWNQKEIDLANKKKLKEITLSYSNLGDNFDIKFKKDKIILKNKFSPLETWIFSFECNKCGKTKTESYNLQDVNGIKVKID